MLLKIAKGLHHLASVKKQKFTFTATFAIIMVTEVIDKESLKTVCNKNKYTTVQTATILISWVILKQLDIFPSRVPHRYSKRIQHHLMGY